uniref:Secreted protein n=1 Tax=Heterorhabditis bacteriophora TaxID=37862 RepID=A0A1I7XFD3_HETBA
MKMFILSLVFTIGLFHFNYFYWPMTQPRYVHLPLLSSVVGNASNNTLIVHGVETLLHSTIQNRCQLKSQFSEDTCNPNYVYSPVTEMRTSLHNYFHIIDKCIWYKKRNGIERMSWNPGRATNKFQSQGKDNSKFYSYSFNVLLLLL